MNQKGVRDERKYLDIRDNVERVYIVLSCEKTGGDSHLGIIGSKYHCHDIIVREFPAKIILMARTQEMNRFL